MKYEIMVYARDEKTGENLLSVGYECDVGHLEQLRKAIKGWGVTGDLVDVLTRTLNETTPVREPQGDDE